MFQKGDLIVYGNMGVCRVEAVEAPAGLPGAGEKKLYYKLDPVYETGTVYIPVDAKVFMRPILTHAQAEALIGRIPEIEENPCLHMQKNHCAGNEYQYVPQCDHAG